MQTSTQGLLFFLFFFFATSIQAQQTVATIKVTNQRSEPLPYATIWLSPVSGSLPQQQKLSDSSGLAIFEVIRNQQYTVAITTIGYDSLQQTISIEADRPQFSFALRTGTKSLGNVVVTATRPLMRQEDDKTIVEPEILAAASTNAFEILEKTPGLFVDQDGNIYLNSTTPAAIYINGREQKMSTADVAALLKSLPPGAIASIEILRTPSARYDASGSGGIVNVVLKKGVRIGLTGSVHLGGNQGRYGNQFAGMNLNNNNGSLTTYFNLQVSRRNSFEQIKTDRQFAPDSLLSQDAFTKYPTTGYYLGYGLNHAWNKKWEVSYDGRLGLNHSRNNSSNASGIRQISTGMLFSSNEARVQNRGNNANLTQGLALKYKLDSIGSEWTTDLSYTYSPAQTEQQITTVFQLPERSDLSGTGDIKNRLHFFSAQTNLLRKLPHQISVETGLKSTFVRFRNTTRYTGTNAYRYAENINATYLQASKNFSGILVKVGTRLENTNMQGNQLQPTDTSFTIHRTDLFPYVYISRNIMKIAGYDLRAYLVYRRTISRPAYEYLNPSPRFVDQYLLEAGNPSLRPQFTKNYEANISVDERPIIALGYNDTKDIFSNVIYQADSSRSIAVRTYDNLGGNKETYLRALGAIPPGRKYFFVAGVQYNHNFYQGVYEAKPLQFKRGSWTVFTYQTLKLTRTTQLVLNGFARFKGQVQFYELSPFGALNMSLNQQFLNKKLLVSLSAQDLFFTNNNEFFIEQGSIKASGFRKGDTRRFGLNIRYNFGFRKREEQNLFNVESPEKANQ